MAGQRRRADPPAPVPEPPRGGSAQAHKRGWRREASRAGQRRRRRRSMNPALKRLGFGEQDRVLIIHADDIGMCQATLPALADALDFGLVSSAAVMAPCGWFPAAAAFCRAHPGIDMGVHLTLNSEWDA